MATAACLWCETQVKLDAPVCPQCGLPSPAGPVAERSHVGRHGRRVLLAVLAVPLMLSAAYGAKIGALPLLPAVAASPAEVQVATTVSPPPPAYTDPLQQSVWSNGMKAVRQAVGPQQSLDVPQSYVHVAAGRIVTFCGQVAGTSGYDSVTGEQRVISIFGEPQATALEGSDTSFDVLWNRVCAPNETAS